VTARVPVRPVMRRLRLERVFVDNAAGRFYEPSDRLAVYAGLRWSR
jgi:hypothetical protein